MIYLMDRVALIASRLAPTRVLWSPQIQCGSELAREGASTGARSTSQCATNWSTPAARTARPQ
ncbi:hypothetical protein F7R20_19595 [Pseudomonas brassicacearum subsp. brassicacearum]|nr:hypothetical protein F7R20_19595 [Pseudomonas brassicacearum subsp. brassicacearum]PJH88706.1 hypothetical protein CVG87_13625 [Pseudomonas sp. WCS365]QEO80204.1 hypothetical protein ELZ14_22645 [Pseudomonas brassicacearum]